jgi:DNA-binding MarR family transcriptional regulator
MASPAPSSASTQEVTDTSLRQFVGYSMKRAFNTIHADLIRTLRPLELRMVTFSALALIVENPGLRQAQLADALSIERPNLVMVIDELEKKNWIARTPVPSDRRAYALSATSRGKRQCDKAIAALSAHEARMLEGLGERNCKQLASWLQTIETDGSDTV